LSFGCDSEIAKQILGNNKLENGVAQEFQTLVIKMVTLRFVTQAGVRERFGQQKRVAELIADTFFERRHATDSQPNRRISSTL
jgi:hypothetical protein